MIKTTTLAPAPTWRKAQPFDAAAWLLQVQPDAASHFRLYFRLRSPHPFYRKRHRKMAGK